MTGAGGATADGEAPRLEVVVLGGTYLELVFGHVPRLPGPGEEIFTDEFAISCGGAVTVADAAAAAGARVGLAVRLGPDLGSRLVEAHCRTAGVSLGPALRIGEPVAGITVVANFQDERAFLSHLPPAARRRDAELARWRGVLATHRPAWCCLHAGTGVTSVLEAARSLGVRVALDASLDAIEQDPAAVVDCARLADLFLPNEAEARLLTGEGSTPEAAQLARRWCPQVVVKRGPLGALVATAAGTEAVAAGLADVAVRDRTGAGDAFAGAMIGALVHGAELIGAVTAGNAAGSVAVARLGGVGEVDLAGLPVFGR